MDEVEHKLSYNMKVDGGTYIDFLYSYAASLDSTAQELIIGVMNDNSMWANTARRIYCAIARTMVDTISINRPFTITVAPYDDKFNTGKWIFTFVSVDDDTNIVFATFESLLTGFKETISFPRYPINIY